MRIRNISETGDWTFGKGRQNYLLNDDAIALNIKTRLLSFLGDCFFDVEAGIDWFNLLDIGKKNQLEEAIRATIAKSDGVTRIRGVELIEDISRNLTIIYSIDTVYSNNIERKVAFQ